MSLGWVIALGVLGSWLAGVYGYDAFRQARTRRFFRRMADDAPGRQVAPWPRSPRLTVVEGELEVQLQTEFSNAAWRLVRRVRRRDAQNVEQWLVDASSEGWPARLEVFERALEDSLAAGREALQPPSASDGDDEATAGEMDIADLLRNAKILGAEDAADPEKVKQRAEEVATTLATMGFMKTMGPTKLRPAFEGLPTTYTLMGLLDVRAHIAVLLDEEMAPMVRAEAAIALGKATLQRSEAVAALRAAYGSARSTLLAGVLDGMVGLWLAPELTELEERFDAEDAAGRVGILRGARHHGRNAETLWLRGLDDRDVDVQRVAAEAFGVRASVAVLPALRAKVRTRGVPREVRVALARSIKALEERAPGDRGGLTLAESGADGGLSEAGIEGELSLD